MLKIIFNNIMNKIVPDLEFVSEMYDKISSNIYYRARISEKDLADRSDIFHLPYDANKSLERSYRYSMKNQHFLYLGATIYTCYQECGEPNVDNFYVAAFDIPQNYRILRLAILPYEIKSFIEKDNFKLSDDNYKKLLLSYINILPLIMACSVKKKNNQAVEEYIVPQAVMNWVVNGKKWNGIEYFSNVVLTYSRKNYKLYSNLVLISKNDSIGERFCKKLSKEIKFTKPLRINGLNLFKEYTDNEEIKPIFGTGKILLFHQIMCTLILILTEIFQRNWDVFLRQKMNQFTIQAQDFICLNIFYQKRKRIYYDKR